MAIPPVPGPGDDRHHHHHLHRLGVRAGGAHGRGDAAYDALGNLRTTTDASGHVTTLTHDVRGRKTAMTDPDMGGWSYTYNALGELTAQSDAKGQTVTMAYDKLGRMTTRTEAEGTTTWTYDTATKGKGRLHTVSAPGAVVRTHAYDAYTRPASETTTVGTQTFTLSRTYDGAGRVAKLTYPKTGFAVEHLYTASGYLGAVRNAATPATVYWEARALSAEGQVAEARYGNGVGTTRTYDAQTGRVQSIRPGPGRARRCRTSATSSTPRATSPRARTSAPASTSASPTTPSSASPRRRCTMRPPTPRLPRRATPMTR